MIKVSNTPNSFVSNGIRIKEGTIKKKNNKDINANCLRSLGLFLYSPTILIGVNIVNRMKLPIIAYPCSFRSPC